MNLAPIIHQPTQPRRLGRLATVLLFAIAAAGLPGCDENDPTGTDLTTSTEGAQAGPTVSVVAADAAATSSPTASATTGTLPLPLYQRATSSEPLFRIEQTGSSMSGLFSINNTASSSDALKGFTNAISGNAVAVHGVASYGGRAGYFENTYNANSNSALAARTMGSGTAGVFLALNGGKGMFINSNSKDNTLEADNSGTGFAAKFYGYGGAKGVYIQTQGGAGLQVVGGTKNAVVHTPSGAKALYTEESTEVWFTDYGFGKLTNGRARVLFDPSFAQTINPDERYHVFLQPRGRAELYVGETTPLGFEVVLKEGDPSAEFSYRIVAKRLGFERKRLEPAPWADRLGEQDGRTW